MIETPNEHDLVEFFKALGEPHRLRIVGMLAQRPHSVEQLAEALGLGASTVSHHLTRLSRAGLIRSRNESYYNLYTLETAALADRAKKLLAHAEAARPPEEQSLGAFDRKVLATFTSDDGRITAFPTQEKKMRVLVRHVLPAFSHGVRYSEKRVNEVLARFSDDTARLRRWLVELRYMAREGGGGRYWRIDAPKNLEAQ